MVSPANLAWTSNAHHPVTKKYKNTVKENTKSMVKDNSAHKETTVSIDFWITTVSDAQGIVSQTAQKAKFPNLKMDSTQEDVHYLLSVLLLNVASNH